MWRQQVTRGVSNLGASDRMAQGRATPGFPCGSRRCPGISRVQSTNGYEFLTDGRLHRYSQSMTGGYNPPTKIFLVWRGDCVIGVALSIPRPYTGVKMIRSCIRQAVRVFAGAAFLLARLPRRPQHHLQQMNCDSLTLNRYAAESGTDLRHRFGAAERMLRYRDSTTGSIGTTVTLTAVCCEQARAATYAWSGGSTAQLGNAQAARPVENSAATTTRWRYSNAQGASHAIRRPSR